MLFFYLDESFQLKKGGQDQILIIAGFSTLNPKTTAQIYRRIKKRSLPKRLRSHEIKGADRLSIKKIKPVLYAKLTQTDAQIFCASQLKNQLPANYFPKNRFNFDRVYFDLILHLLENMGDYNQETKIIIVLDTFKTKTMTKAEIQQSLKQHLEEKFTNKNFTLIFDESAGNLNLQIADQICSSFYHECIEKPEKVKLIESFIVRKIENPLTPRSRE